MWKSFLGYKFHEPLHDWCEPNYVYSNIIAQFWNTLTANAFLIVGLWSIIAFKNEPQYYRIKIAGYTVLVIWFGTLLYHMTLTREGQAIDELSIIYWLYSMAFIVHENYERYILNKYNINLKYIYILFIIFITYAYFYMNWAIFHYHNTIIAWSTLYFMYKRMNETYKTNPIGWKYFKLGFIFYLIPILLWAFEIKFCKEYSDIYPKWLNIHAWIWHIGASICIYYFHNSVAYLTAFRHKHKIIQLSLFQSLQIKS